MDAIPRLDEIGRGDAQLTGDVVVLGAGVSGLSFAFRAAKAGRRVLVIEREAGRVGGCLHSHRLTDGFWFELGAHGAYASYGGFVEMAAATGALAGLLERGRARGRFGVGAAGAWRWLGPAGLVSRLRRLGRGRAKSSTGFAGTSPALARRSASPSAWTPRRQGRQECRGVLLGAPRAAEFPRAGLAVLRRGHVPKRRRLPRGGGRSSSVGRGARACPGPSGSGVGSSRSARRWPPCQASAFWEAPKRAGSARRGWVRDRALRRSDDRGRGDVQPKHDGERRGQGDVAQRQPADAVVAFRELAPPHVLQASSDILGACRDADVIGAASMALMSPHPFSRRSQTSDFTFSLRLAWVAALAGGYGAARSSNISTTSGNSSTSPRTPSSTSVKPACW